MSSQQKQQDHFGDQQRFGLAAGRGAIAGRVMGRLRETDSTWLGCGGEAAWLIGAHKDNRIAISPHNRANRDTEWRKIENRIFK